MDYAATLMGMGLGLGVLLFILIIAVAMYVLNAVSHMKALKALGYDKAWLAWIPYGVWFACADSVSKDEDQVRLFDSFNVPSIVFKLWWIVPLALLFIPLNSSLSEVINVVLRVVFLGCTYAKMYARLDYKSEKEEQVLGCVSGFIPIVAIVKFLTIK